MKQHPIQHLGTLCGLLAVFALTHHAAAKPPLTVELPADSVDGLAAAIAAAGPGGTVLIKSGLHTESGTVLVDIPVKLLGEAGSIIACGTAPSPLGFPVSPAQVIPTLFIRDAHGVTVQALQFIPVGAAANCAILIQDADRVQVLQNHIHGFQFGVLVQRGDRANISDNTVECVPLWVIDPQYLFVVQGINNLNGAFAQITNNRVSGAFFGIFANDRSGHLSNNQASGCYIGFQFCHMMYGIMEIFQEPLGANVSCTGWHAQNNNATGNALCGYLVIDGANHNVLANNAASANTLDIILTGDGDFFGVGISFPASYDNVVAQASHKGLIVQNCGTNNTISGDVTLVPCP